MKRAVVGDYFWCEERETNDDQEECVEKGTGVVQTCSEITFVSVFDVLMGLVVMRLTQIYKATKIFFDKNTERQT